MKAAIAQLALSKHFARHIRGLQFILRTHFGKSATSDSGECRLSIGPDNVLLTDNDCRIVARGPVRIATVLVRKRRKAK